MKNLNLNAYGVQEMNKLEMVDVDGGVLGAAVKNGVKFVVKAITSGVVYDVAKSVASTVKYDPAVNYTPWAGPAGGGFK